MRLFADLFGYSTIISYFCRRICGVIYNILSHKVGMRYVYTRKRQLDGLPLGCLPLSNLLSKYCSYIVAGNRE